MRANLRRAQTLLLLNPLFLLEQTYLKYMKSAEFAKIVQNVTQ